MTAVEQRTRVEQTQAAAGPPDIYVETGNRLSKWQMTVMGAMALTAAGLVVLIDIGIGMKVYPWAEKVAHERIDPTFSVDPGEDTAAAPPSGVHYCEPTNCPEVPSFHMSAGAIPASIWNHSRKVRRAIHRDERLMDARLRHCADSPRDCRPVRHHHKAAHHPHKGHTLHKRKQAAQQHHHRG